MPNARTFSLPKMGIIFSSGTKYCLFSGSCKATLSQLATGNNDFLCKQRQRWLLSAVGPETAAIQSELRESHFYLQFVLLDVSPERLHHGGPGELLAFLDAAKVGQLVAEIERLGQSGSLRHDVVLCW